MPITSDRRPGMAQVRAGIVDYVDFRPRFTSGASGWCAQVPVSALNVGGHCHLRRRYVDPHYTHTAFISDVSSGNSGAGSPSRVRRGCARRPARTPVSAASAVAGLAHTGRPGTDERRTSKVDSSAGHSTPRQSDHEHRSADKAPGTPRKPQGDAQRTPTANEGHPRRAQASPTGGKGNRTQEAERRDTRVAGGT